MSSEEMLRHYLMEQRRILLDQVATIERALGLESKEQKLQRRVEELERRLSNYNVANLPANMLR